MKIDLSVDWKNNVAEIVGLCIGIILMLINQIDQELAFLGLQLWAMVGVVGTVVFLFEDGHRPQGGEYTALNDLSAIICRACISAWIIALSHHAYWLYKIAVKKRKVNVQLAVAVSMLVISVGFTYGILSGAINIPMVC